MASQWLVKKTLKKNRFEVYWREVYEPEDLATRLEDLLKCGWPVPEALEQIERLSGHFKRCNTNPDGYTLSACEDYMATYAKPGDLMVWMGHLFVMNEPASA